ncbi:SPFH domain-containing protein [Sedimentisphaera salicampi]|uniref:FtsH protease regulator HflK n=1 Tax=Sedimentisphaera salicampi TaxID=1941349 RepID=A0A1W6LK06_9BACT|nr:SPFH domain-containing protein [Sedimentisphaera salicampi]ARN56073.1 FtsH protease regulator HflK [Sedimentisphaera salicampi]OXU15805.1 FtsH protease regulator HflK [Sedimentisphaera salicampi]
MKDSSRKAMNVALGGLILSLIGFLGCLLTGIITSILPVQFIAWHLLGAAIIWLYLIIYYHNFGLAEREKRDEAILKSQDETIFQDSQQRQAMFSVARKRFKIFQRWGGIVFSVLSAAYSITIGLWLISRLRETSELVGKNPLAGASAMIVAWFASFLLAKYASGMSSEKDWQPLRAGGSYLISSSAGSLIVAIALGIRFFHYDLPIVAASWIVPVIMLLFGAETILNTVLDIYRPRIKGAYHRPGLDSRLLGIISQPGSMLHTAASTIDYQFGFKVSQTWFYRLLEKAILPLLFLLILCMYLMSCFVVVGPGKKAAIEHLGSTDNGRRIVGPGMHFKWPAPFDKAYIHDTERIQQLNIGIMNAPDINEETDEIVKKPLLWGQKHQEVEFRLVVATESSKNISNEDAPPVSLIVAAVPVQYRVKDLYQFLYNHKDPEVILKNVSYREIARYMASAKLETDIFGGDIQDNESVLGAGRKEASEELTQIIQTRADELGLGVEIVTVGLQGIHPPLDVASDYEEVIGAVQKRQESILSALAERNKTLTELGGSLEQVNGLYKMLSDYEQEKDELSESARKERLAELDKAFLEARGQIAEKIFDAEQYAFKKKRLSKASGERFKSQLKAYRAAPKIYLQNERLLTLERSLEDVRKYIVVSGEGDSEVMIVDLKQKLNPDIYDLELPEE